MRVSVIVPNHGRDLTKLIDSVNKSTVIPELIVIDIGKERSEQRNIGIKKAMGDALLILDSDQSISPDLIAECIGLIRCGYSAIYIPEIIVAKSLFGQIRKFERWFYTGTAVDVPRFVLKKACPMFDTEQKGTEDSDWDRRIVGLRTISKNVLYHHDDINIFEYFKKKDYYAKSLNRYRERNPDDIILNPIYRCLTVYTEKSKWKHLIRHPILTFFLIIIIAIRAIIYYKNILYKPNT
jgi:glycosyltransferase involved in cell wall biosynthesis